MRSDHDPLAQAGYPDPFTDEDLADLRLEIVREVTSTLMFGSKAAPEGCFSASHEEADRRLTTLCTTLLRHRDTPELVAELALHGTDDEGALRFGALLFLVDEREGARFWWGFAAGAGNTAAAQCLRLYHLARGELRDADLWTLQAATGEGPAVPRTQDRRAPVRRDALRAAVGRLTVDAAEESGHSRVPRPAQDLADRIEELAEAL